jgi:hypothetical protein
MGQAEDKIMKETYFKERDRAIPHISGSEGYPRMYKPSDEEV